MQFLRTPPAFGVPFEGDPIEIL